MFTRGQAVAAEGLLPLLPPEPPLLPPEPPLQPPVPPGPGFGRRAGRGAARGARRGAEEEGPPPPLGEERITTDVSDLLSSIGFSVQLCNRITTIEQLINVEDFLALQEGVIDMIFKRLDTANITYSVVQLSLFKALHHYIKRLHSQNIYVNPATINRNVLISEMDDMQS